MKTWKYIFVSLILINVVVWLGVITYEPKLSVIACDVGQGDATLITQGSNQILLDGGPNEAVLTCLGRYMPFWDHTIELILVTHPQADHFRGLIEVTARYNLDTVVLSKADNSSKDYTVLKNQVGGRAQRVVIAEGKLTTRLGKIYLDIFGWMGDPVAQLPSDDNQLSLVAKLTYDEFTGFFTGDAPVRLLTDLINHGSVGPVNYLKVSHHGSKTGLDDFILSSLKPEIATISVGKNSYGHPNQQVLDLLNRYQIRYLRTDESGDIRVFSDGKGFQLVD